MKADFSEFSFGFAYTFELAGLWQGHLIGAPRFPSLINEGRPGGGYDVRLDSVKGFVYCAQFKRSEYMVRRTARETQLGYGPMPYFRFSIYGAKTSSQHELLLDLEADGFLVEYVAPLFVDSVDLDRSFSARNLLNRVIRVCPSSVGALPDTMDHSVTCDPLGGNLTLYSDPVALDPASNWGSFEEDGFELRRAGSGGWADAAARSGVQRTLRERLNGFVERTTSAFGVPQGRFEEFDLGVAEKARAVARTLLGADLLIISDTAEATIDLDSG